MWRLPSCSALFLVAASCALAACSRQSSDSATSQEELPRLGAVPQFSVLDQAGAQVGPDTLRGRPFVAAFMFTRCPSICPRITARMKEVQAASRSSTPALHFVSISVDPQFDTPEILTSYARQNGLDTTNWSLWTGPYETIARAAEQGFKIGLSGKADPAKPDFGITHGSHLILVDGSLQIRGYYRSFDDDVVERLTADLSRL